MKAQSNVLNRKQLRKCKKHVFTSLLADRERSEWVWRAAVSISRAVHSPLLHVQQSKSAEVFHLRLKAECRDKFCECVLDCREEGASSAYSLGDRRPADPGPGFR